MSPVVLKTLFLFLGVFASFTGRAIASPQESEKAELHLSYTVDDELLVETEGQVSLNFEVGGGQEKLTDTVIIKTKSTHNSAQLFIESTPLCINDQAKKSLELYVKKEDGEELPLKKDSCSLLKDAIAKGTQSHAFQFFIPRDQALASPSGSYKGTITFTLLGS